MKKLREEKSKENEDKPEQAKKSLVNSNFIVDNYKNIEMVVPNTIQCLIHYLRLPNNKLGIAEVFRQALENS